MKTAVFKTTVEGLNGEVELRLPNFDEKYAFLEELDIDFDQSGNVKESDVKKNLKTIRKMVALSLPFYEKVNIVNTSTQETYSSVSDLQYTENGHKVLIEMSTKLISGNNLGNEKKPL